MPVEVTHLHSSLEGVTPTEVPVLFGLIVSEVQTKLLYITASVLYKQVRWHDQSQYPEDTIKSFVGKSCMVLLCPPACLKDRRSKKRNKGLFAIRGLHTHTRAHAHNQHKDNTDPKTKTA